MSLELLFGSPQVWPPVANPAIAYTQPSFSPASRLLSPLMPPGAVQTPPALSETAGGVTAAALLAAVAVRRGQPLGPTSDQEIEDFIGDALDLLPGSSDIEIRCDSGRVTVSGQVSHKRLKRDAGEIAWFIPGLTDVQNNVTIVARRRSRSGRETESPIVGSRKQA